MKSGNRTRINTIKSVSGSHNKIVQIYAPGSLGLRQKKFPTIDDIVPFSIDWLIFSQKSVPFFERTMELAAIDAFLDVPESFCWWAIVGEGGMGKSRLCMEAAERLPEGWTGGFIAKETITLRDAAAWHPEANTLWVLDYAATHLKDLREIITAWEDLFQTSPFKVRLLLIERAYNDSSGWWSELKGGMGVETIAVNRTLYKTPLVLAPLQTAARAFLTNLTKCIGSDEGQKKLKDALSHVSDEELMKQSQFGNPFLLLLFAANLQHDELRSLSSAVKNGDTLIERYLGRELDLLKNRCEVAGLNVQSMFALLFVTTSLHPISIPRESDIACLMDSDGRYLLITDQQDGKKRFPTIAEAREMGVNIDSIRQNEVRHISTITGIDDIDAYLTILEEAGLANLAGYSLQPDRIGEEFIGLILNASNVKKWLKQKRGLFSKELIAHLIEGCICKSFDECVSVWARLSDSALLALADHHRFAGKSIRLTFVTLREIWKVRGGQIPFDPHTFFATNGIHSNVPEVGQYFADVIDSINRGQLDKKSALLLAHSEHTWILPYIKVVHDLKCLQRARLGLIICNIENPAVLRRLTNLSNFLDHIFLSFYDFRRNHETYSDDECRAYGHFADAAIDFGCNKAYSVLIELDDKDFKDPYLFLLRMLIEISYLIANEQFGRSETPVTRRAARDGLEVARRALALVPSDSDKANLDRNLAILTVIDSDDSANVASVYEETLNRMQEYASAEDFTGVINDLLYISIRSEPTLINHFCSILCSAPQHLVIESKISDYVIENLFYLLGDDALHYQHITSFISPLCGTLFDVLRLSDSDVMKEHIDVIISMFLNASSVAPDLRQSILDIFIQSREWMDQGDCSESFIEAVLIAAMKCHTVFISNSVGEPLDLETQLPFNILLVELRPEDHVHLYPEPSESVLLERFSLIRSLVATYTSQASKMYIFTTLMPLIDEKTINEYINDTLIPPELERKILAYTFDKLGITQFAP